MHSTSQTTQVFSLFGSGFVAEQRADETRWNLAPSDNHLVDSLTASMFDELLTSLRSALSLKKWRVGSSAH